jgi:hypothetical protein
VLSKLEDTILIRCDPVFLLCFKSSVQPFFYGTFFSDAEFTVLLSDIAFWYCYQAVKYWYCCPAGFGSLKFGSLSDLDLSLLGSAFVMNLFDLLHEYDLKAEHG